MKTLPFLTTGVVLASGLLISVAAAQSPSTALVLPTSPAPAVALPATSSSAVAALPRPAPERIISVPRLPTAAELTEIARAQGVTIDQIDQTASDVTIIYRFADGRTSTVAYQLLPAGTASAQVVEVGRTEPTVVYYTPTAAPQRVYYYRESAAYYDPFYYPWFAPVAVSFGVGYHFGHGGHWGGGGHHRGGHHW